MLPNPTPGLLFGSSSPPATVNNTTNSHFGVLALLRIWPACLHVTKSRWRATSIPFNLFVSGRLRKPRPKIKSPTAPTEELSHAACNAWECNSLSPDQIKIPADLSMHQA